MCLKSVTKTLPWIVAEIIPLLPPAQRSNTCDCSCIVINSIICICHDHLCHHCSRQQCNHYLLCHHHGRHRSCLQYLQMTTSPGIGRLMFRNSSSLSSSSSLFNHQKNHHRHHLHRLSCHYLCSCYLQSPLHGWGG